MGANNKKIRKFIELIEFSISIANSLKLKGASVDHVEATINTLQNFSNLASSGKLPRISTGDVPEGTGLGLVRGIGEWTEDDDLLDAVFEVEQYYRTSM